MTAALLAAQAALSAVLGLMAQAARADEAIQNPEYGTHYRLFTFEKNENPQNILIIYTRLDDQCRFKPLSSVDPRPVVDFYWMMNRQTVKPVNGMIRSAIRKRLEVESLSQDRTSFSARIKDFRELKHDLKEARFRIVAKKKGGSCDVDTLIPLGPSDGEKLVRVETVYSEAKKTFLPPFRKVTSISLIGETAASGDPITKKYTR